LHGGICRFESDPGLSQTSLASLRGGLFFFARFAALVDSLLRVQRIIMPLRCKNIVSAMPKKAISAETRSFTVTLSAQAVSMLDRLIVVGIHGSSRAEVARTLILSRLEQLSAPLLMPSLGPSRDERP
jgi:hypothetical protein